MFALGIGNPKAADRLKRFQFRVLVDDRRVEIFKVETEMIADEARLRPI